MSVGFRIIVFHALLVLRFGQGKDRSAKRHSATAWLTALRRHDAFSNNTLSSRSCAVSVTWAWVMEKHSTPIGTR